MIIGKQNKLEGTHIPCSYIAKWDAFCKIDVIYLVTFSVHWLRWYAVYVTTIGNILKKLDGIGQAVAWIMVGGWVLIDSASAFHRLERETDLISRQSIVFCDTDSLGQWPFRPLKYLEDRQLLHSKLSWMKSYGSATH